MHEAIPLCVCGKGKIDLRCAGKSAINAGRFYYKCPVNGKHPGSFKWCDESQEGSPNKAHRVDPMEDHRITSIHAAPLGIRISWHWALRAMLWG
ncbi:hypothetical protein AAHA92_22674 [Salvia divinorum]|uniref:GRF-type domain-containing protein n=1 Tax=Salvia divinorum TaxID=28513 RepID=A0ABD1GPF6_SALDI